MNKKLMYVIAGLISLVLISLILWHFSYTFNTKRDSVRFKNTYESYNNLKSDSGELYESISISKDNKIKYINFENLTTELNKGTSLIYLGYPTDAINRLCVQTIIDSINSSKVERLYYFEISKSSNDYKKILEILNMNELELPNILAIRKGELVGSLVFDFINEDAIDKDKLVKNINNVVASLLKEDTFCDDAC